MNKRELANKIIGYLGSYGEDWITADTSRPGVITFIIKDMKKPVYVNTKSNITDGYRAVAYAVVEEGLNHGNCKKILEDEESEKESSRVLWSSVSTEVNSTLKMIEQNRINALSEEEKLTEIFDKYGIKVMQYEV